MRIIDTNKIYRNYKKKRFANYMRRNPTNAERLLRVHLSKLGFKFQS